MGLLVYQYTPPPGSRCRRVRKVAKNTFVWDGLARTALMMSDPTSFLSTGVNGRQWYGSLIDNAGFSAIDESDTMSSHSGWSEFTDYLVDTIPPFDELRSMGSGGLGRTKDIGEFPDYLAASRDVTTLTPIIFQSSGTLRGFFFTTNIDKTSAGYLLCAGEFPSLLSVEAGGEFQANYVVLYKVQGKTYD